MTDPAAAASLAERLNALPEAKARASLLRCCGAAAWVKAMIGRRPFRTDGEVLEAAEAEWWALDPAGWREAFAAHPRIGERLDPGRGDAWSRGEQAGMSRSTDRVRRAMDEANRRYEALFDHVFLICATGRSGEDMLRELWQRLENDPETELRVAAEEQAKITRLRLLKLAGEATGDMPREEAR